MKKIAPSLLLVLASCASKPAPVAVTDPIFVRRLAATYSETSAGLNQRLIDQGFQSYWKGDFTRAINQFEAAFLLDSQAQQTWAKYVLYYCYLATGQHPEALTVAESLVKERPHDSLAYLQVGVAHVWLNHPKEAVHSLLRAREFSSRSPSVDFYLGLAYEAQGKTKERNESFDRAEAQYEQILKVNPADFEANYELAKLLLYRNQTPERAAALIQTARQSLERRSQEQLGPERSLYAGYYLPRLEGILLHRLGDLVNSQRALFDSISGAPSGAHADLAETYLYVGRNYAKLGESPNAAGFLERALSLDPDGPYSREIKKELRALTSSQNKDASRERGAGKRNRGA
jgi:tetratricopeptide (TPR) repeat protein